MIRNVYRWLKSVQTFLLPNYCVFCHKATNRPLDICTACEHDLILNNHACECCDEPLEKSVSGVCGHCLSVRPFYNNIDGLYLYKSKAKDLVSKLKNAEKLCCSKLIAQLMFRSYKVKYNENFDCIVAVPSHSKKYRSRGFNQSDLIARHFSKLSGIAYSDEIVRRVTWSKNQVGLSRKKRFNNIKNAFEVNVLKEAPKSILLIDDVVTTSATVNEVSRVLKKAGVEKVTVLAFARTAK